MRGFTYTFDCERHPEFGELGWKLQREPNADPLGGMAVAHDCLEHTYRDDMSVEGELMALGASFYVRQYSRNTHSLGKNVSADLPDVLRHVFHEGMRLRDPGLTRAIDVEGEIDDAIAGLRDELAHMDDLREQVTPEILGYIRGWMRKGYRKARARWQGINTRELFDEIEREADRRLKHAEEGGQLIVRLVFHRALITDARWVDVKITGKEW